MQQNIYQFPEAMGTRYGDPLRIYRRLQQSTGGRLNDLLTQARSGDPVSEGESGEALLQATVFAFDLVPFTPETGQGVTEETCRFLLSHFVDWMEQKKTKQPTLQPTFASSDQRSSVGDYLRRESDSALSSTESGSDCSECGTP